jgi:hypothetical protein
MPGLRAAQRGPRHVPRRGLALSAHEGRAEDALTGLRAALAGASPCARFRPRRRRL